MPNYDYFCEANGETIKVHHDIHTTLTTWGELCFAAQYPLGETDVTSPIRKVIHPVSINIPISNSRLKEVGFTKLVKHDDGVYENVTATNGEKKYMKAGDDSSLPHLHKKISS